MVKLKSELNVMRWMAWLLAGLVLLAACGAQTAAPTAISAVGVTPPADATGTPEPMATPVSAATATVGPVGAAVEWRRERDGACETASLDAQGVLYGRCGETPQAGANVGPARAEALARFVVDYAPFEAETPAGWVRLAGAGERVASSAEQRMVAEWAQLVAQEAAYGRGGASWGLALAWHREGGIAGFCDDLSVYVTGEYFASSCAGQQPADTAYGWLSGEQMAQLYGWLDSWQIFELEQRDAATADSMTVRLVFSGSGPQAAGPADQQAVLDLAGQLYAELGQVRSVETQYVLALQDLTIYSGPGTMYGEVGPFFDGQTALVTGASSDLAWWRVICPDDTVGSCWLPADPALTAPAQARPASPYWVAVRDPQTGVGLAYPCFWVIDPPIGPQSARSFDEAYFMANAVRGQWLNGEWPAGAVKVELALLNYADQNVAPGTPVEEALPQLIDDSIAGMTAVSIGRHSGLLVNLAGVDDPNTPDQLMVFDLGEDRLLLIVVWPRPALASADVQAILASLALSDVQEVALPAADPAPAVSGRSVYLDEERGFCFAYPDRFEQSETGFGQPAFFGPALDESPEPVRASLLIDAQEQPAGELGAAVDAVLAEYAGIEGLTLERQPMFLGGEPAEMLEVVPGREGSRDVLALHDGQLYRLLFMPSMPDFPEAAPDVQELFLSVTSSWTFLR